MRLKTAGTGSASNALFCQTPYRRDSSENLQQHCRHSGGFGRQRSLPNMLPQMMFGCYGTSMQLGR